MVARVAMGPTPCNSCIHQTLACEDDNAFALVLFELVNSVESAKEVSLVLYAFAPLPPAPNILAPSSKTILSAKGLNVELVGATPQSKAGTYGSSDIISVPAFIIQCIPEKYV